MATFPNCASLEAEITRVRAEIAEGVSQFASDGTSVSINLDAKQKYLEYLLSLSPQGTPLFSKVRMTGW